MTSKPEKNLTVDGVTRPIAEWAKILGMSPTTIHGRKERGWTDQECLTRPVEKPAVSKSDAEFALNDMTRHQLPSQLEKLIPPSYKGIKYGEYLRNTFRKEWDHWFATVYLPNHSKKKS